MGITLPGWVKKYRLVLLVALLGMVLMCLPTGEQTETEPVPVAEAGADLEERLETILSRIQGAGAVAVMLTEDAGEEVIYQTDGDGGDTVILTDGERSQQGLVRTRQPPRYRGAVIVCQGADSPAVRLAIVEAVANVTGLGSDKISVLKMK